MSDIQQKILARIDQGAGDLGYRPPTFPDLVRACGLMSETNAALSELLASGIIDTETGDSGTAYRLAKPPYVPELAAEKRPAASIYPSTPAAKAIGVWPKKASTQLQSLPANCAAVQAARVLATKAKFKALLVKPMTINEYAAAADASPQGARELITRYVKSGFLQAYGPRPKLIRVAR